MISKKVGVIGGLGPKTGFEFGLHVNNKVMHKTQTQPEIILTNVPMSPSLIAKIARGFPNKKHLNILKNAMHVVNKAKPDFIVIPCNTVHVFIKELRKVSKVPILSIVEETARFCRKKKLKCVGILGSQTTIDNKLHTNELMQRGIHTIIPCSEDQKKINEIIIRINKGNIVGNDKQIMRGIIQDLMGRGAENIILACTDLYQVVSIHHFSNQIINTTTVLEDATVASMIKGGIK